MDLHILSEPVTDFWKCPKMGLKTIRSTKTQFKNLKFGMVVNWSKYIFVDTHNLFLNSKKWFRQSVRSDFDKIIDQSSVNRFSWKNSINS